jgi:hypothetical protein
VLIRDLDELIAIPNYGWEVVNYSMLLQLRAENIQSPLLRRPKGVNREKHEKDKMTEDSNTHGSEES